MRAAVKGGKLISIVTSAYNEEGNVEEFARQLQEVFSENPGYEFEVIAVDNGSADGTFEKLLKVREKDPRFKIVQLARNFRMDGGITAGLQYARGDAAVIMTANLQDKPALITVMIGKWEEGYENVYGIVEKRSGKGFFRRISSELFYLIINKLTHDQIPRNASDFRLVDRKVYETINKMGERNRFLRGMFAWVGFKSVGIKFERQRRFSGKSHADFLKVLNLAIKGIFAFSYIPIQFIAASGFVISALSLLYLIISAVKFLIVGVPFPGYGTITSLIVLLFGLMFFFLGVLGQYIAQIYEEVKTRPNFIVCRDIGFDPGDNDKKI
ncbi:MAG: glycosyltransferase family 2 protein [Nitrospiraceae bacterium]|nr:glycosyltransferase family 2 protein [Nitrospiraceae bacterium]